MRVAFLSFGWWTVSQKNPLWGTFTFCDHTDSTMKFLRKHKNRKCRGRRVWETEKVKVRHRRFGNVRSDAPLRADLFNQLAHLLIKGTNYAIERLSWWLQTGVGLVWFPSCLDEGDDLVITCVFISQITVPGNGNAKALEHWGQLICIQITPHQTVRWAWWL